LRVTERHEKNAVPAESYYLDRNAPGFIAGVYVAEVAHAHRRPRRLDGQPGDIDDLPVNEDGLRPVYSLVILLEV
jgi:hypothetical protein